MHKQPDADPVLPPLLAGLPPDIAATVTAAPFRTLFLSRAWSPAYSAVPEIEAVVVIDGKLTGKALAQLIEAAEAAEDNRRALLLVADDHRLRDAAKRRLVAALEARQRAGGRA
jgi:hypothetical protein